MVVGWRKRKIVAVEGLAGKRVGEGSERHVSRHKSSFHLPDCSSARVSSRRLARASIRCTRCPQTIPTPGKRGERGREREGAAWRDRREEEERAQSTKRTNPFNPFCQRQMNSTPVDKALPQSHPRASPSSSLSLARPSSLSFVPAACFRYPPRKAFYLRPPAGCPPFSRFLLPNFHSRAETSFFDLFPRHSVKASEEKRKR